MKAYYGSNATLTANLAVALRVALYSVAPTVNTAGTELSGSNYSRAVAAWSAPVAGVSSNSALITFPTASANWASIVAIALLDVSGNIYYIQTLGAPISILSGQFLQAAVGGVTVTET